MRKQTLRVLLLLLPVLGLLVLSSFSGVKAANPNLMSFQGKVVNSDGTNVSNGSYNFRFRLYTSTAPTDAGNACSANSCIWEESKSVTVNNGVFQTELGDTTTLPDFSSYTNLYLGIKFNNDAQGEMNPRIHLDSVAYAQNADKLGGLSASAFAQLSAANAFSNTNTITATSATAFQVKNSSGEIMTVDTSGNQLILGKAGASGITGKLAFKNGTNSNTASIQSGTTGTTYTLTLPTALPGTSQCIQSDNAGVLSFTGCSGGSVGADSLDFTELSDTMTLDASTSIGFGASNFGLNFNNNGSGNFTVNLSSTGDFVIQDNATPVFTVKDDGLALFHSSADSAQALVVEDSGSHMGLAFDTTNSHLKVYEDTTTPTNYVDIYFDNATTSAIIAASTGTTKVGNGSGPITINPGSGAAVTITGHAASTWSTDSGALTLTSAAAATWSTSAGGLTIQSGSGTVSLGSSTGLTANGGLTISTGSNGAVTLAPNGTGDIALTLDDDSTLISTGIVTNTGRLHQINLTLGNDADVDTVSGLEINTTSAATGDADVLYGLNIGNLSGASSTVSETGLRIGTGWDNAIKAEGNILVGAQTVDFGHTFTSCSCTLNSAAGTFGSQTARDAVTSSIIFRGKLFVAVKEADAAGIYRYDGGTTWTLVTNSVGKAIVGDTANIDQYVMSVWNGSLYIGSQTGAGTGALYSSFIADTTVDSFSLAQTTRGTFGSALTGVDGISDLAVYNGSLYLGTQEPNLAEVDRFDGGTTLTEVSNTTEGRIGAIASTTTDAVAFAVWGGRLFAGNLTGSGGNAARVSVYTGVGTTWTDLTTAAGTIGAEAGVDDITSMTVWNGALYVSTGEPNLSNVYRWEAPLTSSDTTATNWRKVNSASGKLASSDTANIDSSILKPYAGRLYAGSYNATDGTAALYSYSGATGNWALINSTRGTFNSETIVDGITALQEWDGKLYVGIDDGTNGKASVYSYSESTDQSYALTFEGAPNSLGAIRFIGSSQAAEGLGHQGTFNFSSAIATSSGAFDYAEDYPTLDSSLEPGEPVAVDPAHPEHVKRASIGEPVLGVVSQNPGFRLSSDVQPESGAHWVPIALVGRVPVKVTTHEGKSPIKAGDPVAVSAIPGVLEKAGPKSGAVVGVALAGYSENQVGKVSLYVSPQLKIQAYDFNPSAPQAGLDVVAELPAAIDGDKKVELANTNVQPATTSSLTTELGKIKIESAAVTLDLQVDGTITASAGLIVGGPAEFQSETTFQKLVTFVDRVVFKKDVAFEGHATFSKDAGGKAIIRAGDRRVEIKFKTPYIQKPIVNANYELEDSESADGSVDNIEAKQARLVEGGYSYAVGLITEKGFVIILNKPATEDVQFHWLATSVKDATVSQSQ